MHEGMGDGADIPSERPSDAGKPLIWQTVARRHRRRRDSAGKVSGAFLIVVWPPYPG